MYFEYLNYLFRSHNRHGVHSPFVYDFNENVLNHRIAPHELMRVNKYREFLNCQSETILVEDLGSGSHKLKQKVRVIKEINRTASINERLGEILFRLIQYYQCRNIIELGTCLGMGTAYIQEALKLQGEAEIISIEGSELLNKFTRSNFTTHFSGNKIDFRLGNFDVVLPNLLNQLSNIDLVIVDGNHSFTATCNYFQMLLPKMHSQSIIIFDDIHWSKEMHAAWQVIKKNPKVKFTIDIFRWGIVFFREEMEKEDFILRFDSFLKAHIH